MPFAANHIMRYVINGRIILCREMAENAAGSFTCQPHRFLKYDTDKLMFLHIMGFDEEQHYIVCMTMPPLYPIVGARASEGPTGIFNPKQIITWVPFVRDTFKMPDSPLTVVPWAA